MHKNITYKIDGKEIMKDIISHHQKMPLVYMVHDWDGITDYEIKKSRYAKWVRICSFAVDLWKRDKTNNSWR